MTDEIKLPATVEDTAKRINDQFAFTTVSNLTQVGAAIAFLMLVRQLTARHKLVTHES